MTRNPTGTGRITLTSVHTENGATRSHDGLWLYEPAGDGTVHARLVATGQRGQYTDLRFARRATCNGSLLAEFAAQDAAAMREPCRGCGGAAAALVDTVNGPQPTCDGCAPVARARGYTVRPER